MPRPKKTYSKKEQEYERLKEEFDAQQKQIEQLTLDAMNKAPKLETEPQTKLAKSEVAKMDGIVLKPIRKIDVKQPFNEKFRAKYEFDKQYVKFTAENNEIIGEKIECWTRPYGGVPAEFWEVPVNTPVWGPRYLAEQIKRCTYHRLVMEQTPTTQDQHGHQYVGGMVASHTINRLDAHPAATGTSIFIGAT